MTHFDTPGVCLGYQSKLLKHMKNKDMYRLKDYVCAAYDTIEPLSPNHPCHDVLMMAMSMMMKNNWKVSLQDWKNIGRQVVIVSPKGEYYHSKYEYGK